MQKALEGIKVIDLTRVLAGPYCTMVLGDMGAEVLKVERPGVGDDSRQFGPFINDYSAYFTSINRNKKSITLNLKTNEGKEILKKLIKEADVIVENFRPGTMEKLGLGYETLKEINKEIIYAASSGFGHTGPYSHKPAYDLIIQGLGGMMSITGQEGGIPTKVGASIGDIFAGVFTAIGILGALRYRDITKKGQKIDVSMLDCQVAVLENALARYLTSGKIPKPIGNRHPSIAPFSTYTTKDDFIIIAIGNDPLWAQFCQLINRSDLLKDVKYKTNHLRVKNNAELEKELEEIFITKTTQEWIDVLDNNGIPCGPINNVEDVINNPQIKARNMIVEIEQPTIGNFQIPALPIKFSETPSKIEKPSPFLGEDNESILKALGFTMEEIIKLNEKGII
ncbi:MAG: CoA transferase [Clostridia bacterium]|nr:CoA transferase [Clostridia bacterium]